MAMEPLTVDQISKIADMDGITYEPLAMEPENAIATRMSRVFKIPQERMFEIFAKLEDHPRFLPHLKTVKVITNEDLGNVLQDNQVIIVEGLEEGGSRIGIKLFTLHPPNRIDGELLTDPFNSVAAADPKKGAMSFIFERVDESSSKMTVESTFIPESTKFFKRGMVDHVWVDFFENTMVELGEISQEERFCNLLGDRTERFRTTFEE